MVKVNVNKYPVNLARLPHPDPSKTTDPCRATPGSFACGDGTRSFAFGESGAGNSMDDDFVGDRFGESPQP